MVKTDNATVNLIKVLAPGFLALFVIGSIVDISTTREFDLIFYGFILTLICWAIAYPLLWVLVRITGRTVVWDLADPLFACYMAALGIVIGIVIAIGVQGDIFYRVLRSLPGTEFINRRSAKRPLSFLLLQNTTGNLKREGDGRRVGKVTEAWVRVHLKQGSIFSGWPEFYGGGREQSEIYLSPACHVEVASGGGERATKHKGPGILVYEREISTIEFVDRAESACFLLWAAPQQKP